MATITKTGNNTLLVTLTPVESDLLDDSLVGQLGEYLTLWLRERVGLTLKEQIAKFSPQELAALFTAINNARSK